MAKTRKGAISAEEQQQKFEEMQADLAEPQKARSYDYVVLDITMAERVSTNPEKTGREGFALHVDVIKTLRTVKISQEQLKANLKHMDWRSVGTPNHHPWFLPTGAYKLGDRLSCECNWNAFGSMEMHVLINGERYV